MCQLMCHHIICQGETVSIAIHHLFAIPEGIVVGGTVMDCRNDGQIVIVNTVPAMLCRIQGRCTESILVGGVGMWIDTIRAVWLTLVTEQGSWQHSTVICRICFCLMPAVVKLEARWTRNTCYSR